MQGLNADTLHKPGFRLPLVPRRLRACLVAAFLVLPLTACGGSDDKDDPVAETPQPAPEPTPESVSLKLLGRYETGVFGQSAAEIPAYDAASKRGFVVNAQQGVVDVLDLSNPAAPAHIGKLDASRVAEGAVVNSVAVHGGVVALAIEAAVKTEPGHVGFFKAADLSYVSAVRVGALPDMLTFTPDGKTVLVANEGEPNDDYSVDPEGSISVIDISNLQKPTARVADFQAFNGKRDELLAQGVRIFGPDQSLKQPYGRKTLTSVAKDLEPEYITVSADGKTAWATLQENNALARIDVANAKVTAILPLGYKDHGVERNALDVTNTDLAIKIQAYPGVFGMYQPDAIASYSSGGATYLVTANEGDSRAWGEDNKAYFAGDRSQGFVEEFRVKHLVHNKGIQRRKGDDLPPQLFDLADGAFLNPEVFAYCGATVGSAGDCREDNELGRLKVTWTQGYRTHQDGSPVYFDKNGNESTSGRWLMYDRLYSFGARSFSIRDENGGLVWDSGAEFERFLASDECKLGVDNVPCKTYFNSAHNGGNAMDDRSDDKGPEPEGIEIGSLGDKTFAFIGLERMGGVMVYDVTNPRAPVRVDYINTRNNWKDDPEEKLAQVGDLGPEGLKFIPAAKSPNGKPLLMVGYEVSGTTAVYEIEQVFSK